MAKQLIRLRGVPDDELEELHALLTENSIDYYETDAGNWGISMPALWLSDETQYARAKALLDAFHEQRYQRVRAEYEALKRSGKARTLKDIISENPGRYILYTVLALGLIYVSIIPFAALSL